MSRRPSDPPRPGRALAKTARRAPFLALALASLALGGCDPRRPAVPAAPVVRERMVVYLIVDGLRLDALLSTMATSTPDQIDALVEVFGPELSRSRVFLDNHSVFPSVTFAANATFVTGTRVSAHGIVGNSFFDRKALVERDLASTAGISDVFHHDLADRLLERPTLYQQLAGSSLVSYHFFGAGAEWVTPGAGEAVWNDADPAYYDYLATGRLLGRLRFLAAQGRAMPKVATLYWPGLDSRAHKQGADSQPEYIRSALNPNLRALLDGPTGKGGGLRSLAGGLAPYVFVLVADHGHTELRRWIAPGELRAAVVAALRRLPEYQHLSADELRDCYRVEPNGGMAHIYLRAPGKPWSARLFDDARGRDIVLAVGRALRVAPGLANGLDLVFAASTAGGTLVGVTDGASPAEDVATTLARARARHPGGSDRYPGAEEALQGIGSAGGDILVTSDYEHGHAFLSNGSPASGAFLSVHGNLFASDMRVPLVVAGEGVAPGAARAPGGITNAARIVAELAGTPLSGLPGPDVSSTAADADDPPVLLTLPKSWAEAGRPYRCRFAGPRGTRWTLMRAPDGATIDPATGELAWTPALAQLGDHDVELLATFATGRAATERFVIHVYPAAPASPRAMFHDGAVELSWQAAPGAASYVVRRLGPDDGVHELPAAGTSLVDPAPPQGARLAYIVEAVGADGRRGGQREVVFVETR